MLKSRELLIKNEICNYSHTAWKVSKSQVISGTYFPVFSSNTGKYGPEITPYLDTFYAVTKVCILEKI